jgi:hypothetical protein
VRIDFLLFPCLSAEFSNYVEKYIRKYFIQTREEHMLIAYFEIERFYILFDYNDHFKPYDSTFFKSNGRTILAQLLT